MKRDLACLFPILALVQCLSAQHFPSKEYIVSDGMPSNSVFDITQDTDGMMWFVTKSGPTYYDTRVWHTFSDSLDLPSSSYSRIKALNDKIWVVGLSDTAFTIQYYQNHSWRKLAVPPEEFQSRFSFDITEAEGGYEELLIGKENTLYWAVTDNLGWNKTVLENNHITSIKGIGGQFYITTEKGLYSFSKGDLKKVALPYADLPSNHLLGIDIEDEIYYILGYNWFASVSNNQVLNLNKNAGLNQSSKSSKSNVISKDGLILFGSNTPARLISLPGYNWTNLLVDGKNANIGSTKIFIDAEGSIWVSDFRGLFKFNSLQFENYNQNSGLAENEVSAIYALSNGGLVLANPGSFNILKNDNIKKIEIKKDADANVRILDVLEDPESNRLLFATHDAGLLVYDQNDLSKVSQVVKSPEKKFTSTQFFQGQLYVAGNEGFYRKRGDSLETLSKKIRPRNMTSTDSLLMLFTFSNGIYWYNGLDFRHFASSNFDLNTVYNGVFYNGQYLFATAAGIAKIDGNKIVPSNQIAIRSPVYSMLVDSKNLLWIGTDNGVYRYDGAGLKHFNTNSGLLGNETNRNALVEDQDGNIWIGTEKGASMFKGDLFLSNKVNLNVDILRVNSGDESIFDLETDDIRFLEKDLEITFQCLSYINEDKINYRYQIQESGPSWIHLTNSTNSISLSNIEAGSYNFKIQARYENDSWGPISGFRFVIRPPFYNRWWFIVLAAIALALLARSLFHFRYLLLIKKQQRLKKLVADRTREINELNEHLEEKVKSRTKELNDKNIRLEEYAHINAHYLRGPLSKIMSVVYLLENDGLQLDSKESVQILKESVNELDSVIYSINDILKEKDN